MPVQQMLRNEISWWLVLYLDVIALYAFCFVKLVSSRDQVSVGLQKREYSASLHASLYSPTATPSVPSRYLHTPQPSTMAPRKAAASDGVRRSSRIADLPKPAVAPKPRAKTGEVTKGKKRKSDAVEKGDDEGEKPASKKVMIFLLIARS